MTLRLINRVERLELARHVHGAICPECGHGPPQRWNGENTKQLRVTFDGDGDETPVHCPACGRLQVLQLEFDRPGDE